MFNKNIVYFYRIFSIAVFFVSIFLQITCRESVALPSAQDHAVFTMNILGINTDGAPQQFADYLKNSSSSIDDVNYIRKEIREDNSLIYKCVDNEKNNYEYTFKHRLLHHWGFNSNDPKNHRPLMKAIDQKIEYEKNLRLLCEKTTTGSDIDNKKEIIINIIKNAWIDNSRKQIIETQKATGLTSDRAKAFATIIHDIHILADYLDQEIEYLEPIDSLFKNDLGKLGIIRLFRGTSSSDDANQIVKSYSNIKNISYDSGKFEKYVEIVNKVVPGRGISSQSFSKDQRIAVIIIGILAEQLPEMLKNSYGKALATKGIQVNGDSFLKMLVTY